MCPDSSPASTTRASLEKRELITDSGFRALYLDHDAAYDWSPNDPRLPGLADRTRSWFAEYHSRSESRPVADPAMARLAAQSLPRSFVTGLGPPRPAHER
jgi:hypothetical protein